MENNIKKRLLFMDDNADIREIISEICSIIGFDVECTSNGQAAVAAYKSSFESPNPFDAVILDLTVSGGLDGEQTFHALREIDPNVKAIIFSGYSSQPIVYDYEKYGFKGRLDKPIEISKFKKIIEDVINRE